MNIQDLGFGKTNLMRSYFESSTISGHVSDVRNGKFHLLLCEKLPVKREAPCLYKLELELIHLYFWNAIIKRKISKFEANI